MGSGTCAATLKRSMASYHLRAGEHEALVDIGAGSLRRLLEAGKSYDRIAAIFISHLHIDHIGDLVPFLWATRFTPEFERTLPLQIYGPPGTAEWYGKLAAVHGDWLLNLPFSCDVIDVQSHVFRWQHLDIRTLPMAHSVVANGYRFMENDRSLVYSGDTGFCQNIVELGKNADLLLIECSFPDSDEEMETHLMPTRVGEIAASSGARKVVLTHMYPICDNADLIGACGVHFRGEIELAEDLTRFTI